ncbi:MAG: NAD(P)H-dependent oxidoreductase [Elusimicrobia bacterium]|nr:NAD(P)H-dependent oxidoreductase [Elusimicrobiota bacterium]
MKKILVVESSPLAEASVSRRLTKDVVAALLVEHPGSEVATRDLAARPLPHLSAEALSAFAAAPEARSPAQREAARASEEAAAELLAADVVVIGAPMWNFGVPSALKAWIDHVVRAGKTFSYSAQGPKGLAAGRRAIVASASGGIYSEGPGEAMDFHAAYLRAVLAFIGISDVSVVRAEGLAIPGVQETAYEKARGMVAAAAR